MRTANTAGSFPTGCENTIHYCEVNVYHGLEIFI